MLRVFVRRFGSSTLRYNVAPNKIRPHAPKPVESPSTASTSGTSSSSDSSKTVAESAAKKSHNFRNFVLLTIGVGASLYGVGVWYALHDDRFHDFFSEYVPFSETIVSYVEDRQFRKRFQSFEHEHQAELAQRSAPQGIDKVIDIPLSGVIPEDLKNNASAATTSKPAELKEETKTEVTKEPSKPSSSLSLPLIHVPSDVDPLILESVESFNKFIRAINNSSISEESVSVISKTLTKLSYAINSLKNTHKQELEKSLSNQAAKFASLQQIQKEEIQKSFQEQESKWLEQFHQEQERLLKLYNERLLTEIEATKKVVIAYANNKILAINAERERQFASQIAELVETERNGRLSKLSELSESIAQMQDYMIYSELVLSESQKISNLHVAIAQLTNVLLNSPEPVALRPYIDQVKQVSQGDELISSCLSTVPFSVLDHGVLTNAQLSARFKLLEPEIRKASLLPPNAGIAGHVGSIIFSKLLWKKEGNPVGNDVESIIARTECALTEGRIVDAVQEINQLKGWPKKLAQDWLDEGRKKSEVEFIVGVLSEQSRLWNITNSTK